MQDTWVRSQSWARKRVEESQQEGVQGGQRWEGAGSPDTGPPPQGWEGGAASKGSQTPALPMAVAPPAPITPLPQFPLLSCAPQLPKVGACTGGSRMSGRVGLGSAQQGAALHRNALLPPPHPSVGVGVARPPGSQLHPTALRSGPAALGWSHGPHNAREYERLDWIGL